MPADPTRDDVVRHVAEAIWRTAYARPGSMADAREDDPVRMEVERIVGEQFRALRAFAAQSPAHAEVVAEAIGVRAATEACYGPPWDGPWEATVHAGGTGVIYRARIAPAPAKDADHG